MIKKFIFSFILIIFFGLSIYYCISVSSNKKIKSSDIYKIVKEYSVTENIPEKINLLSINDLKKSSEKDFFTALNYYNQKDINKAEYFFSKVKSQKHNDPVLSLYAYVYLNECKKIKTGYGSPETIKKAFDIMKNYPVFSNDVDLVWQLISTIMGDSELRESAVKLLDNYLKNTHNLKIETQLKIKGSIAMIKMTKKEYGESIYLYYEILSESKKIKNPEIRSKIQIKSYEYLGNMYFILEDYREAIKQYDKADSIPVNDLTENAVAKYGSYVGRSESYIQLKEYEKAEKYSRETEKIIPYLPEKLATGVKIFRYKNLLLLEAYRNNFSQAEKYYNMCLELLEHDTGDAFVNSRMYVETAHCELLIQQKKYYEASQKLDILLKKDLEENWGFETLLYLLQLKVFKETNQAEKYFDTARKMYFAEKEFTDAMKKDYLNFVKHSYTLEQLRKQERISSIKILSLGIFAVFAFFSMILGILQLRKLNKGNFTDSLTNVYNRKYLNVLAKKKLKNPVQAAVIMVDIDYFKKYNDFYGHPAGDMIIKKVARILKENIRQEDIVIRYGGEEFLIFLKNADISTFEKIYTRIDDTLSLENIPHEKSQVSDKITLSMGVSFKTFTQTFNLKNGIEEADKALYISKNKGRNCYTIYK